MPRWRVCWTVTTGPPPTSRTSAGDGSGAAPLMLPKVVVAISMARGKEHLEFFVELPPDKLPIRLRRGQQVATIQISLWSDELAQLLRDKQQLSRKPIGKLGAYARIEPRSIRVTARRTEC